MSDSERGQQIKDLIRRHLENVGAKQWKVVRLQCPDISEATFWRYVKAVREEADLLAWPGASGAQSINQATDDEVPNLGALPNFYNPLQKARQYQSLLADAEIMRGQAVDHRGKITNWRMFDKSIHLRERLLAQQGEVVRFFQSQGAFEKFYEQLIEIVDELPKEVAIKFMQRLHKLQQQQLVRPPESTVTTAAQQL